MKRIVPGEGNKQAKTAFIGEAPGQHEDRMLRPFYEHAPAGRIFTSLLHSVGLVRRDIYVTNVIKERPPRNDVSIFLKLGKGTPWESPAFKQYKEELKQELLELKPYTNVFVPMGNVALWAICGKPGGIVKKWRGSILEGQFWPGMKCIPTIHPVNAVGGEKEDFALKRGEYIYTHFIRMDLKKIIAESHSPEIVLPQRTLVARPSFLETMAFLESLRQYKTVGVDIEVMHGVVSCISFSTSPGYAVSIAFIYKGWEPFNPVQESLIWKAIAEILEDPNIMKVGQNLIGFDVPFLFRQYGIRTAPVRDTMVAMHILFPDFPKGLNFITTMYTKEPYYKDEGKQWLHFGEGEDAFLRYNARDSAVAQEVDQKLQLELVKQGNQDTFHWQNRLLGPLTYIASRGIRVDAKSLKRLSGEATKELEKLEEQFRQMVKKEINLNSPVQLSSFFYDELGITPYLKKGKRTTEYDALVRLSRSGVTPAEIVIKHRKLAKLKGTYYDMKMSSDGRLRSAWDPVGATTGRLSSSKDIFEEGGDLQNLPEAFRKFVLADIGYVMYSFDASMGENRIVAYVGPEPAMIKAFEDHIDLHKQTAGLIFKIPIEQVSDERGSSSIGGGMHSQRFWGKKANHSLNYDEGYKTFSLKNEIPEREGKLVVERYHQGYPGVRGRYHPRVRQQLSENRILTNLFGRKRLFLDRWGDGLFKDAYAQIPQSTIADIVNRWGLIPIYEEDKEVDLLLQGHDSILLQLPISLGWEAHAKALLKIIKRLEQPLTWYGTTFVIPFDISMGINYCKDDMRKVKAHGETASGLADQLSSIYEQYRSTPELQTMDWNKCDSLLLAEED